MEDLERIVSTNLTALRKRHSLTQAELAEKINYSDKSVSKWERGEALPDLKVLKQLADLFGVTVDCFLTENAAQTPEEYLAPKSKLRYQIWVTLLAICFVWLTSTVIFVYATLDGHTDFWTLFVWAVPASMLVLYFFDLRFFHRRGRLPIASLFCWTLITAIFLQWLSRALWMLYIIGVPVQIIMILMAQIRKSK